MVEVKQYHTKDKFYAEATAFVLATAIEEVEKKGSFYLALAGGSTPQELYRRLISSPIDMEFPWEDTCFFFGDERHVPMSHDQSNFGACYQNMLSCAPIPEANIFRMKTEEADTGEVARKYEIAMRKVFNADNSNLLRNFPRFDLIMLGIGADGHTASLFPGSPALDEQTRWVVSTTAPAGYETSRRLTLTLPVLNSAARVMFLATGEEKRRIIDAVINNPDSCRDKYPAACVMPVDGTLVWFDLR